MRSTAKTDIQYKYDDASKRFNIHSDPTWFHMASATGIYDMCEYMRQKKMEDEPCRSSRRSSLGDRQRSSIECMELLQWPSICRPIGKTPLQGGRTNSPAKEVSRFDRSPMCLPYLRICNEKSLISQYDMNSRSDIPWANWWASPKEPRRLWGYQH